MQPLLSYEDIRQVATLLWLGLVLLGVLAWDTSDDRKANPRNRGLGATTYCPLHRVTRDKCEAQH